MSADWRVVSTVSLMMFMAIHPKCFNFKIYFTVDTMLDALSETMGKIFTFKFHESIFFFSSLAMFTFV